MIIYSQYAIVVESSNMPPMASIWRCPVCYNHYSGRIALRKHLNTDHSALERQTANVGQNRSLPRLCTTCHQVFNSAASLLNHKQRLNHWGNMRFPCGYCHRRFESAQDVQDHTETMHFRHYTVVESAFSRNLETVERVFGPEDDNVDSVDQVFVREEAELMQMIGAYAHQHWSITAFIILMARMVLYDDTGAVVDRFITPIRTRNHQILQNDQYRLQGVLQDMRHEANTRVEELELTGSGYSLERIVGVVLSIGRVVFAGGSFTTDGFYSTLTTSQWEHCIDIESHVEDGCLFTAVAQAFLRPNVKLTAADRRPGGDRYEQSKTFVTEYMRTQNIKTPTPLSQLAKFENMNAKNRLNFSLNVFMIKKGAGSGRSLFPVYIGKKSRTKDPDVTKFINILLVRGENGKMHFIYIADFDMFVNATVGKKKNLGKKKYKTCVNCLQRFSNADVLDRHHRICLQNDGTQAVKVPNAGSQLTFKNFDKQVKHPIIGFADFEASMRKRSEQDVNATAGGGVGGPSTIPLNDQLPTTFALIFLDSRGNLLFEKTYSSDTNLLRVFFETLFECEKHLLPLLTDMRDVMPTLTVEQAEMHQRAERCYLCNEYFTDETNNPKVIDHSHSSLDNGAYLGAAHNTCNLQRREQKTIPIFLHNFCHYDSAFLCQALADPEIVANIRRINAIPLNTEKFKTIRINAFSFGDSLAFLNNSLANLVTELKVSNHEFPLLDKFTYCGRKPNCDKDLLVRKSVYPYDWSTSVAKIKATTEFPPPEAFHNVLTQSDISVVDYQHGVSMYNAFECQNFLQYCEVYCLLDVFLLAEVVTTFRNKMHKDFGLDMAYYMSSPQLSFDNMLKLTGVKLELMSDPEMVLLLESGLRGGVSFVGTRHVEMPEPFDPDVTPECLLYLDVCNLYGKCMADMFLPTSNFRWLSRSEMDAVDWLKQERRQSVGYIIECDLIVPEHLHEKFSAMPLAQEKYTVDESEMSDYSVQCQHIIGGGKKIPKSEKLCGTLHEKKNFLVHYVNLKHFLEEGLILDKVHRVITFSQSPFLRDYVKMMSERRKNATTDFERTIIKLLVNSIYGKLIEGVRKYMDVKFVTSERLLNRYLTDPCYSSHRILGETCCVFFRRKKIVLLDKLYAAGFSILELSKNLMTTMYYGFMQRKFGVRNLDVLMSDTDSYILHIRGHTQNEALKTLAPIMDFSNYPHDHPLYNGDHRKMIPGYFKNETPGSDIREFCGLRSKCYIIRTKPDKLSARCKGINRKVVKNLTMENYKSCLQQMSTQYATMRRIRSKNHKLTTIEVCKISLSSFDSKRFLFKCGVHSVPFGSKYISEDMCPKCDNVAVELMV